MECKTCKLKDIATVIMGQSPKGSSYSDKGNGKAFLQGNRTFGRLYPVIDTWTTEPNKIAKEKSILMSVRAPVGDLNIANQEICIGRGLCSIEMNNGNNEYLFYLLKYSIDEIKRKSSGTVFDSINRTELENIDIIDFDEEIQNKITSVLFNIDKKIELNNQINDNLLDINKNLYKEWFIDFRYPGFNGKLKKSALGLIPEDWEVKKISELDLDISDGNYSSKYPTKSEFVENGVPFIRGTDFNGCSISRKGLMYISELKHEELKKGHLKKNDILITTRGEIGRIAYVSDYFIDANINAQLIRINGKNAYPRAFVGTALLSDTVQKDIQSLVTGTALQQLPVGKFNEIKLVIPNDNSIIQQFNSIIEPNIKKMDLLWQENEYLEQLRDTLLPKLMNGEIDLDKIEI